MPKPKTSDAYIKSVLKTFQILEQFINCNHEKGVQELSNLSSLPPSTVQRIVNTLQFKGYLIQNPKTYKYRLGYTLYHLYNSFSQTFNWVDEAKHYMQNLVLRHKETINLAVLEGRDIIYLTKVDSPQILRPNFNIGTKYPAYCTSLGKCLLAYLPSKVVDGLLSSSSLEPCARNTNTSFDKLKAELKKIKKQGFAIDDEEFQDDLRCAAVPIKNYRMGGVVVASMSITAPKSRMPLERLSEIINDMVETSNDISKLIVF